MSSAEGGLAPVAERIRKWESFANQLKSSAITCTADYDDKILERVSIAGSSIQGILRHTVCESSTMSRQRLCKANACQCWRLCPESRVVTRSFPTTSTRVDCLAVLSPA